ncbi:MAG: hypothetical protein HOQ11_12120 [Gemmatimonadaceae bacterium]|nr:hypothetical protein [Gemmatimonadaceae bacterium]NUR17956.1 hypothetical protein [Gemmatimonadaceae bacterium]NUS98140.1 hypothetical protein [Gemmatimonadaceae bacterium]
MAGQERNSAGTGSLGAGGEAAEGIHGAKTDGRDRSADSSVGETPGQGERGQKGSEPLDPEREHEHRSGYGGSQGQPVKSSDQREIPREADGK